MMECHLSVVTLCLSTCTSGKIGLMSIKPPISVAEQTKERLCPAKVLCVLQYETKHALVIVYSAVVYSSRSLGLSARPRAVSTAARARC